MELRPLPDATYFGGWVPDSRSPVGRAEIVGTGLVMILATRSPLRRSNRNLAVHRELLGSQRKESTVTRTRRGNHVVPGKTIRVFQAYSLQSRVRSILHTHTSASEELVELESFLSLSVEANEFMRHWLDHSDHDKFELTRKLLGKADQLAGRVNSYMLEVAERTAQRAEFKDRDTERINPSASAAEFVRTARLERGRIEIVRNTISAARNNADEWIWVMAEVMADVEEIMAICAEPLTEAGRQRLAELFRALPKPFCYAAAYSWNTRQREASSPVLVMQLHERIRAAFLAELLLMGFDLLMSEVNHNLGLLNQLSLDDLTSGLPGAGFDLPYQQLSRRLREKCQSAIARHQEGADEAANRLILADEDDPYAAMGAKDILRYRVVDPRFGHQMPDAFTWLEPQYHDILREQAPQAIQPRPRPPGRKKRRRQKSLF